MAHISGKNTKPEIVIRKLVHQLGYCFRLYKKELPGKPDLVFSKHKKIIFINGCFWHHHKDCTRSTLPATNKKFWREKIERNVKNDKTVYRKLRKLGWNYLVIWQCQIKKSNTEKLIKKISTFLS